MRQHVFFPEHLLSVSDLQAQWLKWGTAKISLQRISELFDYAVAKHGQTDPGLWGNDEQQELAEHMVGPPLKADGLVEVASWPTWLTSATGGPWRYDKSWTPLANPSPVLDVVPNITVVRGASAVVPISARTTTAFPVTVSVTVAGNPPGLLFSSPEGSEPVMEARADAALGRWTATVTTSDGKYVTTREFDVDVSDTDDPASDAVYPTTTSKLQLDDRHGSFLLDADADAARPFPAP